MKIIEVRFVTKFGGSWAAIEASGVEPAYPGRHGKQNAIDYAKNRFGGAEGEVHVYNPAGDAIEEKIPINGRDRYSQ